MAKDVEEKQWWEDKTIQLPKGLLIRGATGEAVAVYAHMKGFGADVRCSLGALALRLGWGAAKTRRHQNELWALRWIWLLREGAGAGKKGNPRHWWMSANAGDPPPQEIVERVSKNGTLPDQLEGYVLREPLGFRGAPKPSPEANKNFQTNKASSSKRSKENPPAGAGARANALRLKFETRYQATHGKPMTPPKFNWVSRAEADLVQAHGLEEMLKRVDHYFLDPFRSTHPYSTFLSRPDDWAQLRKKLGAEQPAEATKKSGAAQMLQILGG